MDRREQARIKVIGAVLNKLSSDHYFNENPGNYGALASSEMANDLLDEALNEYVVFSIG